MTDSPTALDDTQFQAAVDQASANVAAAEAQVNAAKTNLERLTVTAGLRQDNRHGTYPSVTVGPGEFAPFVNGKED